MAVTVLGKVAFLDRGAYNSTVTYAKWDMVTTNDSTYVSTVDNNRGHAVSDAEWWKCIANGKPSSEMAQYAKEQGDYAKGQGDLFPAEQAARETTFQESEEYRAVTFKNNEGKDTDAGSATGSRWARFNKSESDREAAFAEGASTDAPDASGSRWARFNAGEGQSTDTPSSTGSRWARFNDMKDTIDEATETVLQEHDALVALDSKVGNIENCGLVVVEGLLCHQYIV